MQIQVIQKKIYEIRGHKVILDFDLAELYEVETKALKQAVRRNIERFPSDFMFEITEIEFNLLKDSLRSQFVTSNKGGTRYMPFAFTEQGVAMLSSVLKSKKAIDVNISIMRTFVMIKQHYMDYKELKHQIEALEKEMNIKFKDIYEALKYLIQPPTKPRKPIGFKK